MSNVFKSAYNPQGLRRWVSVDGKEFEIDEVTFALEGVNVAEIEDAATWAKQYADNYADIHNDPGNHDEDEFEPMTQEDANGLAYAIEMTIKARSEEYTTLAGDAVKLAREHRGVWCGDADHDEQVVFQNGVYTVASNGDAADYTEPTSAVAALARQWKLEDAK